MGRAGRLTEHLRANVVAYVALCLAVVGTSVAAINPIGPDGDVDVCFNKRSGVLEVRLKARCGPGEQSFAFAAIGPRGPAGQNGAPGARGATGVAGPTGPAGATGTPGAPGSPGSAGGTGATGATGVTGTQGPTGPQGDSAPEPPPTPYTGSFRLSINGASSIPLSSFAGCYDKRLGVEYEDCYFKVDGLAPAVSTWLNDVEIGERPIRDLSIASFNPQTGAVLSVIDVRSAFISEFRYEDLDGTATNGSVSFIAVPQNIQKSGGGGNVPTATSLQVFREDNFAMTVEGVGFATGVSGITALRDLVMTVDKIPDPTGAGRLRFVQGDPEFSGPEVEVGPGTTAAGTFFDQWSNRSPAVGGDRRDGSLTLKTSTGNEVDTIALQDLVPLSELPGVVTTTGRRSLQFDLLAFR